MQKTAYNIYAILPYVQLSQDEIIDMDAVRFCRASDVQNYVDNSIHENFAKFIAESYSSIEARIKTGEDIVIRQITLDAMTCVQLDDYRLIPISNKQRNELILDAAQLLFFLSNMNVIFSKNMMSANPKNVRPFLRIFPINDQILNDVNNWVPQRWEFYVGEEEIHHYDRQLRECFGKILHTKYHANNPRWARRIIRAIAYYNRIFTGEDYGSVKWYGARPEDIVFLSMAFESLLDVHFASPKIKETTEKFVHTVLNILHMHNSEAKNVLSQWLSKFYKLRSEIVHGNDIPDRIFHGNSNIDIPFINLGWKVFASVLICELSSHACLESGLIGKERDYLENLMVCLWPHKSLLIAIKDLYLNLKQNAEQEVDFNEIMSRLYDYVKIYLAVYVDNEYRFTIKPIDDTILRGLWRDIINVAECKIMYGGKQIHVMDLDDIKINGKSKSEELIEVIKQKLNT